MSPLYVTEVKRRWVHLSVALFVGLLPLSFVGTTSAGWAPTGNISAYGELDCNGQSPAQESIRRTMLCTDIRGNLRGDNPSTWGGKFYDNGLYIGHDEPQVNYFSNEPGSGDNVSWVFRLGRDPKAAPTVRTPGKDVSHYFELTPALWFSINLCDPNSYPELPCIANDDANAPACSNALNCPNRGYPGGGSAFVEMQFYPPGEPPFVDSTSCDDTHWCAALNIDSLECTAVQCNQNCVEPVNFAFITKNGIPIGPPGPNDANLNTFLPNADTLMMNPGDVIKMHMWDAPVPDGFGERAFKVTVDDLTTHRSGSMQASAANGFENTSIIDCSNTPFDFEPEYSSAKRANISPWGLGEDNIAASFETGHFEPCTAVSQVGKTDLGSGIADKYWNSCASPYERWDKDTDGTSVPETADAPCYPKGDTHGPLRTAPDLMASCSDAFYQNGDLDFDGTPYWPEWPVSAGPSRRVPQSFTFAPPTFRGKQYARFFFISDLPDSESSCTPVSLKKCTAPPAGPGHFYPYWSLVNRHGSCGWLFGNVSKGKGLRSFGRMKQYGKDQFQRLQYFTFESKIYGNGCKRGLGLVQAKKGKA